MISKFSSSVKEKLEKYLASSTFELELYNATSNSNSNQASTRGLYLIAEKSYSYESLLTVIARIRQRLISDQRKKWKRINKTCHLIEFLLKNGSMQFVLVFIDKFIGLVKPYVHYEYFDDGVDRGYAIRECSKRIIELSTDRERLREARQESAKLRQRIVGKGGGAMGFNNGFKIDEDAFYKRERKEAAERKDKEPSLDRDRYRPYDKKDKDAKELTLAEKLGMKGGLGEKEDKEDKEHIKKRTKEDQKEVEEVKKILEQQGDLMREFMGDFDIFADEAPQQNEGGKVHEKSPSKPPKNQDMFDLTDANPGQPIGQGQGELLGGFGGHQNFNMGMQQPNMGHMSMQQQQNMMMQQQKQQNMMMQQQQQQNMMMQQQANIGNANISYNNPESTQNKKKGPNDPFSGLEELI